tara:strand:- start:336 stop:548 length:213 start_codon:yes stop_codon:yes gene_type:complete
MRCANKKRYPTKKIADTFTEAFNRDPLIKEGDFLTSYFCSIHEGWHVGHKATDLPPHIQLQIILDGLKNE